MELLLTICLISSILLTLCCCDPSDRNFQKFPAPNMEKCCILFVLNWIFTSCIIFTLITVLQVLVKVSSAQILHTTFLILQILITCPFSHLSRENIAKSYFYSFLVREFFPHSCSLYLTFSTFSLAVLYLSRDARNKSKSTHSTCSW